MRANDFVYLGTYPGRLIEVNDKFCLLLAKGALTEIFRLTSAGLSNENNL